MNLQPNEFIKIYPQPDGDGVVFEIVGYLSHGLGKYQMQHIIENWEVSSASPQAWFILHCQIESVWNALEIFKRDRFGVRYQWPA